MRNVLLTSAIMLLGLTAVPAWAMPIAPFASAPTSVTQVAWGCGPGWTRGPYGHCHPMGYGYGAFAAVPFAPVPFYGSPTCTIAGSAAGAIVTATSDGAGLQAADTSSRDGPTTALLRGYITVERIASSAL